MFGAYVSTDTRAWLGTKSPTLNLSFRDPSITILGNSYDHPIFWRAFMTPDERERMNQLCVRIQEEKDYEHFAAQLLELSELIDRKLQRRFRDRPKLVWHRTRPWKTVSAAVNKLLPASYANMPDKVEISISTADPLFREVRLENALTTLDGQKVALKSGARLDVTIEAEAIDTVKLTNPVV
jgi:hypothetical protein